MKNIKPIIAAVTFGLFLLMSPQAKAQGSGGIAPSPETLRRDEQAALLRQQGETLLSEGNANAALQKFKQAQAVGSETSFYENLARTYVALGRDEDAREMYSQFIKFQPLFGDYHVGRNVNETLVPYVRPLMEYAILLSQMGRTQEAIDVYYSGLRELNGNNSLNDEPIPLKRLFGISDGGTLYTPAKLQAAAHLAIAIDRGPFYVQSLKNVDQAVTLDPQWGLARFYRSRVLLNLSPDRNKAKAEAEWQKALQDPEPTLQTTLRAFTQKRTAADAQIVGPHILRKNLPALENARKALVQREAEAALKTGTTNAAPSP